MCKVGRVDRALRTFSANLNPWASSRDRSVQRESDSEWGIAIAWRLRFVIRLFALSVNAVGETNI